LSHVLHHTAPCQEPPGVPARKTPAPRLPSASAACPSGLSARLCSWRPLAAHSAQVRHCPQSGPSITSFPQSKRSSSSPPTPGTSTTSLPSSSPSPVRKARFLASANSYAAHDQFLRELAHP